MTRHVLVYAVLDPKRGGGSVETFKGLYYSEHDPTVALEQMTGSLAEVTRWAESKGALVEFQLPTRQALEVNRQQTEEPGIS